MSTLKISQIRTDGGTQARVGLDSHTLAKYVLLMEEAQREGIETGETIWPFDDPLEVTYDGENYWLRDGFHRRAACVQVGRHVAPCNVKQGTQRDAILESFGANAGHGLPRSDEDKRRVVTRMLEDKEWGKWSDRAIAKQCRVSHTFVSKIRKEVTGNVASDQPAERTYVTKHGTVATMNTANIGSMPAAAPLLKVWKLQDYVTDWAKSDFPLNGGFDSAIDALESIKNRAAGWRVPFDSIKASINGNFNDGDLRQAVNNTIDIMKLDHGIVRSREQPADYPPLPSQCPECGDPIIESKRKTIGDRRDIDCYCPGCGIEPHYYTFPGRAEWSLAFTRQRGQPANQDADGNDSRQEETAVEAPTQKAMRENGTPFETASGHTVVYNPSVFAAVSRLRQRGHTVEHTNPTNPGAAHDDLRVWQIDGGEPISKKGVWALVDGEKPAAPPPAPSDPVLTGIRQAKDAVYQILPLVDAVRHPGMVFRLNSIAAALETAQSEWVAAALLADK